MIDAGTAAAIDQLIAETRRRRLALHDLIWRIRRDRESWQHTTADLPGRQRLTPDQRERLQRVTMPEERNATR